MIPSPARTHRHLIPRWRSLKSTLLSKELSTVPAGFEPAEDAELYKRVSSWENDKSVITAAELVEAAIVGAKESLAVDAAKFLFRNQNATRLVQKNAAHVLAKTGIRFSGTALASEDPEQEAAIWRKRTKLYPNNALGWVELALAQISKGHAPAAQKSMAIALHLAPENRHVLRSASRLYLHLSDPEKAHQLIARSPATSYDPWLMAAEISISSMIHGKPQFFKKGTSFLEHGSNPREITELAGAIGSTYLEGGNRRKARQNFTISLKDPTGNSFAQAEWVSHKLGEEILSDGQLLTATDAKEAKTFFYYHTGDFDHSLQQAKLWYQEELFSSRACFTVSSIAQVLGQYQEADKYIGEALRLAPTNLQIRNAKAFTLANLGHYDEAEKILATISTNQIETMAVRMANHGLIEFRRGNTEDGKIYYQKAIETFKTQKMPFLEKAASVYYAREAVRAGIPEAPEILSTAEVCNPKESTHAVERVLVITRNMIMNKVGLDPAAYTVTLKLHK